MSNTESRKKVINKTKNIVSATILIMSVNNEPHNESLVRERTIETALNLLDNVQRIRTLTPVYKSQFVTDTKNQIDALLDYIQVGYSVGAISRMNVDILAKELHLLVDLVTIATNITSMQNDGAHIEIPDSFFEDMLNETSALNQEPNSNTPKISSPNNLVSEQNVLDKNSAQNTPVFKKDIKDNQKNVLNTSKFQQPKTYISNNDKRQNRKELILNFITQKRLEGNNEGVMIKDILGKIKDISEKTLQRELSALVAKGVLKKIGDKRWSRYLIK